MLRNVQLCQYDVPTPIQSYVIPSVLQGKDVIGIAQTGKPRSLFGIHWLMFDIRLWQDCSLSYPHSF